MCMYECQCRRCCKMEGSGQVHLGMLGCRVWADWPVSCRGCKSQTGSLSDPGFWPRHSVAYHSLSGCHIEDQLNGNQAEAGLFSITRQGPSKMLGIDKDMEGDMGPVAMLQCWSMTEGWLTIWETWVVGRWSFHLLEETGETEDSHSSFIMSIKTTM